MIKNIIFASALMVLLTSFSASAVVIREDRSLPGDAVDYSGEYMFTVFDNGVDPKTNPLNDTLTILPWLESEANLWFTAEGYDHTVDFSLYEKVDVPEDQLETDTTSTLGISMDLHYDSGMKTGSWETDALVEFYTVKAANEFNLYWLGFAGADSGDWSTQYLVNNGVNQPGISHLSTWNDVPAVPEPSTLLLLGGGLVGLAFYRRRNK